MPETAGKQETEYHDLPEVKIYPEDKRFLKSFTYRNGFERIPDGLKHLCKEMDENGYYDEVDARGK